MQDSVDQASCPRKNYTLFLDNNAVCIADMLVGEEIDECKASKIMLEKLNVQAETHTVGVKSAQKKFADFKP